MHANCTWLIQLASMALSASSSLEVMAHRDPSTRPTACSVSLADPVSTTNLTLVSSAPASREVCITCVQDGRYAAQLLNALMALQFGRVEWLLWHDAQKT